MIIDEALFIGIRELRNNHIADSTLKAKLLMANLLDVNKEYILIHGNKEMPVSKVGEYMEKIERLSKGEPLQYVTNIQEFYGLKFFVNSDVLIPQPDTEVLVETTIGIIKKEKRDVKILDLCTGSGAIAVSLAKEKNTELTASDISKKALTVARKNSSINHTKVKFVESDLFENIDDKYDFIVSNPPYIETKTIDTLSDEVKAEPFIALDGGTDGLDFYRKIAEEAPKHLLPNGYLILEIGNNQKDKVMRILRDYSYENIYCVKDYAQNDRVIVARIKE